MSCVRHKYETGPVSETDTSWVTTMTWNYYDPPGEPKGEIGGQTRYSAAYKIYPSNIINYFLPAPDWILNLIYEGGM